LLEIVPTSSLWVTITPRGVYVYLGLVVYVGNAAEGNAEIWFLTRARDLGIRTARLPGRAVPFLLLLFLELGAESQTMHLSQGAWRLE
jgi:hypothetical protein